MYYIGNIKVWDIRLQMQRLKSVDPTIPFLFYLTKTDLFIFPPFPDSSPSACYVKFSFSEKDIKIWSYHPLDLTFTYSKFTM